MWQYALRNYFSELKPVHNRHGSQPRTTSCAALRFQQLYVWGWSTSVPSALAIDLQTKSPLYWNCYWAP